MNEQGPAVDRSGLRALWLGLGALLLLVSGVLAFLAIPVGVAAIVFGFRARKAATGKVPGAMAGIIMGGLSVLITVGGLAVGAYLYSELNSYQKCMGTANTFSDEKACIDALTPQLEKKFHLSPGTLKDFKPITL